MRRRCWRRWLSVIAIRVHVGAFSIN